MAPFDVLKAFLATSHDANPDVQASSLILLQRSVMDYRTLL
jgi:hypothetical protein